MWKINLRVLVLALGTMLFYTAIAHVIPQLESEVPAALALGADASPEALAAAGERLYNGAGGCTACHGLGTRAPNLLTDYNGQGPIGARCGSRKPGMDCKAYLHESLTAPGAYVVAAFENIMPDMRRQLTDDQIWALIAFLQSQGGEVTVTAADLKPVALLKEKGCTGCHQLDGVGPVIGPPFDHIGRRLQRDFIRRSILTPNADT